MDGEQTLASLASAELASLRDEWIAAENARSEAYRAFMAANKQAPLRKELDAAEKRQDRAKAAYSRALQQNMKASPDASSPQPLSPVP